MQSGRTYDLKWLIKNEGIKALWSNWSWDAGIVTTIKHTLFTRYHKRCRWSHGWFTKCPTNQH